MSKTSAYRLLLVEVVKLAVSLQAKSLNLRWFCRSLKTQDAYSCPLVPDPRHKNRSGLSLCLSRSCFRGQDFSFVLVALTSNQFRIQTQAQVKLRIRWPASDGPALPHMSSWICDSGCECAQVCVNCCNHGSDGDAKPFIIFQSVVKRPSLIWCVWRV